MNTLFYNKVILKRFLSLLYWKLLKCFIINCIILRTIYWQLIVLINVYYEEKLGGEIGIFSLISAVVTMVALLLTYKESASCSALASVRKTW